MKNIILFAVTSALIFSSCTSSDAPTTPVGEALSGTQTPSENVSSDVQEPLKETLSGTGGEYYPIFDGTGTKIIHATHVVGTPTIVSFVNSDAKSMEVNITFPDDESATNLRLSQVVMPDGTMDGPF